MRGIELTPEHPVDEVVDLGVAAEEAGFDTIFASSHWFNRDPFVVLSRLAAVTESVRLGPGVANPYETHPVALASRMATLDEASGGRGAFGIGAGDRSALSPLGIERDRPLRRVLETVRVARRLWNGEAIDHDGTFVANGARLNYEVGKVPVYVGAQGPHMLRMAAKYGDGVLVNAAHPRDLEWATGQIDRGRRERERAGDLDVATYASVSVAEDEERAREAARPPVAFIVGSASGELLDRHGIDEDAAERVGALLEAGRLREAFDAVTEPMIDAFCIAGAPPAVRERLDAALDHVDGVVAASPLGPDPHAAIRLLSRAFEEASL